MTPLPSPPERRRAPDVIIAATSPTGQSDVLAAVRRTVAHLEAERYRGYDPFDALASPVFRLPILRDARVPRFAAQQVVRRLPFNVRPILRIPKGYNPVTLALVLQASAHLADADPGSREAHVARARFCVDELVRMRSPGVRGDAWGYDFDWESRYVRIPAWTPTIVATGFVSNALFTAYRRLGFERALELCRGAAAFVVNELPRTDGEDGEFCWSYSPLHTDAVLNATMKGVRLCAQVHSVTGEPELLEAAGASARFVVREQNAEGAWPYSVGDARRWADNFHTAYVLDCLHSYRRLSGDETVAGALERGYSYYREHFFADGVMPKYFDDRPYPIDATSCAQSVITLTRFGDRDDAARVARWSVDRLALRDGAFAYQVRRRYTVRIPYTRWSTAWMLAALAILLDPRGPE